MNNTKNYTEETLKAAHKHCGRNRQAIRLSVRCGCFYCQETYPAHEVKQYVSPDDALCPKCGIDSVLGDAAGYDLSSDFLSAMYEYWFEREEDAGSQD